MTSEGVLSKGELVQSHNISSVTFCVIVALAVGGGGAWTGSLVALTTNFKALATFTFLSAGIFTFAAMLQVEAVRRLGVSVYGSYSGWRVLVCVLGSYVWLGEVVASWVEWTGILIVVGVLTIYLRNIAIAKGEAGGA